MYVVVYTLKRTAYRISLKTISWIKKNSFTLKILTQLSWVNDQQILCCAQSTSFSYVFFFLMKTYLAINKNYHHYTTSLSRMKTQTSCLFSIVVISRRFVIPCDAKSFRLCWSYIWILWKPWFLWGLLILPFCQHWISPRKNKFGRSWRSRRHISQSE